MHQLQLFKVLISPSPLSIVVIFLLSAAWIFVNSWLYFSNNQLVHQYIFGPNGVTAYTWEGTESVVAWAAKFFASTAGYYVLLIVFGLFTGIAAFALLQTLTLIIKGTANFVRRSEDALRPAVLLQIFTQLWIRSLALIGWAWFLAVTIGSVLPLLEILIDNGATHTRNYSISGGWSYLQAFLVCILTLHMHVVFFRLFLLRPRVFGNPDIS